MAKRTVDPKIQKLQIEQLKNRRYKSRQERIEELKAKELALKAEAEKETQEEIPEESLITDRRFKAIEMAIKRSGNSQDALIEVLHKAQETFGYLDNEVLHYITRRIKLPLSLVYGVATFYHLFTLKPQGEHNCVVCLGTACYVKGSNKIIEELEKCLQIKCGETTTDGKMSLVTARCMGACGIAPAISLDGEVLGKQTAEMVLAAVKDLINSGQAGKIKEKVEALTAT